MRIIAHRNDVIIYFEEKTKELIAELISNNLREPDKELGRIKLNIEDINDAILEARKISGFIHMMTTYGLYISLDTSNCTDFTAAVKKTAKEYIKAVDEFIEGYYLGNWENVGIDRIIKDLPQDIQNDIINRA